MLKGIVCQAIRSGIPPLHRKLWNTERAGQIVSALTTFTLKMALCIFPEPMSGA